VRWNKTAWFYSESGNNGKGTLCSLMRNLCGPRSHTSIPLADFGKNFALEPLVRANAIIVDENDVGTFIDKAANLKAVVTGDVIQIDRKYRMPIAYQFFGFMVQCLNEFPRVKDKSESFYRRQLFVPFSKSFTGAEKRYIKDDYLQRTEVLEYALWYVLHRAGTSEHKPETSDDAPGSYYELAEPPVTKMILAEYKEANDPVRAFWEEFRERFAWDLLPFTFLYDLYKAWFVSVSPSGSPVSRQQFVTDLVAIVKSDQEWHCPDKNRKIRPGKPDTGLMSEPETLIAEYDLKAWKQPGYIGTDPAKVSRPLLKPNYRGLLRQTVGGGDDRDAQG
jgi:putative DNA primase/helicase